MRTILAAAGVAEDRLAFMEPVVETCRECHAWQKRGNVVMASTNITTKFNEEGETDMMFYERHIGMHIIDRAIRLSDGCEVPSRHDHVLLNAYATTWGQRQRPFKIL